MPAVSDKRDSTERLASLTAAVQGIYFAGTGIWPLVHMPSFIFVTGPKRDLWLVRTVGALIAVIGGTLLLGARRGRVVSEVRALGLGSAAALTLVDVIYAGRGVIRPIYLLDAIAELGLIGAWSAARPDRQARRRPGGPRRGVDRAARQELDALASAATDGT